MEQLLQKMARQLDSLDEASLMDLWDKYASIVEHFEPTKRWEESALIFAFIQAKRWKNQAFNYHWALQQRPGADKSPDLPAFSLENIDESETEVKEHHATVIPFQPLAQKRDAKSNTESGDNQDNGE